MGTTGTAHLCKWFLQLVLMRCISKLPPAPERSLSLAVGIDARLSLSQKLCNCQVHVNHPDLAHILHGRYHTLTGFHALLHRRAHAISTCSLWRPWNIHSASTEPRVPTGLKKDDNSRQQVVHQSQLNTHHVHSTSKNAIVAHNLVKKRRLTDFRTTTNVSLIVHGWTRVL